jgi:predicted DsbA family dithiol-disulfide isomerase
MAVRSAPGGFVAPAALLVLLAALAAFASQACGGSVPPAIRDELARGPRGTITVVVFTDFQCPFCRRTHAALAPLVAERQGRVRVGLRHVPLHMHPDARTAARAAVCTESLPARDAVVDALYRAPDLGEAACEEIALEHGAERAAYERCVADAATDARIDRDTSMFRELGGDGVPMMYVDRALLDGSQTRRSLETAIDDALRRNGLL